MKIFATARHCLVLLLVSLSLWSAIASEALAAGDSAPKVSPSLSAAGRAQHLAAFKSYADAWGVKAEGERLQMLKGSLAADMTYHDASTRAEGVAGVDAMIARFQTHSPGVTLRLDDLLLWSDHGLAKWSMMDAKGGVLLRGYDVVTYDPANRIASIVGFFDVPAQRAVSPP